MSTELHQAVDDLADVRAYDDTWDAWTADMTDDERGQAAQQVRETAGYAAWTFGPSHYAAYRASVGAFRNVFLRFMGVIPEDEVRG